MSRKKSRTEDRIGIPKSNTPRVYNTLEKPKTKSGNKSGTRQRMAEAILAANKKSSNDPRAGSKKPIDLSKYAKTDSPLGDKEKLGQNVIPAEPIKYNSPQDELDAIEADKDLELLLEKQEQGSITAAQLAYVNKMTARYRVLCELMGIDVDEYSGSAHQENDSQDDPYARLDAIKLDDFKD